MGTSVPARIVIDTNTLVSAFLFPQSTPGIALDLVLSDHRLLMSVDMALELASVMRRDKFDRYLTRQRRDQLVASTIRDSEFIGVSTIVTACRDAQDNKVLELAVAGGAEAVVTGDSDLLDLHPFQGIVIIPPHEFLSLYGRE
jgi:putative PIN family toxin of toxin-antitoxin system